jgi:tRNA1Val (adenine37-N6)-methyltransferase
MKKEYVFCNEHLKIYQPNKLFKYSLDSLLLASFVKTGRSNLKVLEIGAGTGVISILLADRNKNINIDSVEIQEEAYKTLNTNVKSNKLDSIISTYNEDIAMFKEKTETDTYDIIVCNPPYFSQKNLPRSNLISIAKHTNDLNLETVIETAKKLLKNKGKLYISNVPENLTKIIKVVAENKLEVKRLKIFYSKKGSSSNIILLEISKQAKSGITIESPIYTNEVEGNYTKELIEYIRRNK